MANKTTIAGQAKKKSLQGLIDSMDFEDVKSVFNENYGFFKSLKLAGWVKVVLSALATAGVVAIPYFLG